MPENNSFNGYARVEVMGHVEHTGKVTTEAYGQAVMFRVDRPEIPERDITLEQSEYVDGKWCPAGTVVRRPKIEAVSVLVGAGSIYRILPCTEEAAMKAIEHRERRPLILIRLPEAAQLESPLAPPERPPSLGDDDYPF